MKKVVKPGKEEYTSSSPHYSYTIRYCATCWRCGCEFTYDDLDKQMSRASWTGGYIVTCPHCGIEVVEQYIN